LGVTSLNPALHQGIHGNFARNVNEDKRGTSVAKLGFKEETLWGLLQVDLCRKTVSFIRNLEFQPGCHREIRTGVGPKRET
jgi:hypothetical protein